MNIGVFDSGVGGITVLHRLQKNFKSDSFFYFGDTANVPYGSKSTSMIQSLCHSAAIRIRDHSIDALIVACNTASSLALNEIKLALPNIPIFGMVEAGVHAVIQGQQKRLAAIEKTNVLVLGTRATINSQIYSKTLKCMNLKLNLIEQECPLLVPMIEEGWTDHPILIQTVEWYLKPHYSLDPGMVLLGCTHYPWIEPIFKRFLPNWQILNAAQSASELLQREIKPTSSGLSNVQWFFSDPDALSPFIRATEHIENPTRF